MKIEKWKCEYGFGPVGKVMYAGVWSRPPREHPDAYLLALQFVPGVEMRGLMEKCSAEGMPTKISYSHSDRKLWFWPVPDADYEVTIQYYPPLVEV